MPKSLIAIIAVLLGTLLLTVLSLPRGTAAQSHLVGKVIALDAGHGGGDPGAIGHCGDTAVTEAEVNLVTRAALKAKLEAAGATVFEVPQFTSRRDRMRAAEAAGVAILISIHHNGASDLSINYTQSFVTQRDDRELASYIHPQLVTALDLPDRGIKNDGYGMTVYGRLPGVLTEAYFITNLDEACAFLASTDGGERVASEAEAHYLGIVDYFAASDKSKGHR